MDMAVLNEKILVLSNLALIVFHHFGDGGRDEWQEAESGFAF